MYVYTKLIHFIIALGLNFINIEVCFQVTNSGSMSVLQAKIKYNFILFIHGNTIKVYYGYVFRLTK